MPQKPLALAAELFPENSKLFLPHSPAILADIKSVVGIDLNVATIGSQKDIEDMVSIELGDAAPAVATQGGPLQLPVVGRIDAVDETAYFYCLCQIDGFLTLQKYKIFKIATKYRNFLEKIQKRRKPLARLWTIFMYIIPFRI